MKRLRTVLIIFLLLSPLFLFNNFIGTVNAVGDHPVQEEWVITGTTTGIGNAQAWDSIYEEMTEEDTASDSTTYPSVENIVKGAKVSGTFPDDIQSSNNQYIQYEEGGTGETQDYYTPSVETINIGTKEAGSFPTSIGSSDDDRIDYREEDTATTSYLDPDTQTLTIGTNPTGTFPTDLLSSDDQYVTYREANTGGVGVNEIGAAAFFNYTATADTETLDWTGSSWGTPNVGLSDAGTYANHRVVWDTTTDSTLFWIVAELAGSTTIRVWKCTNLDTCSSETTATTRTPANSERLFDMAIEDSTGQLLLVYDDPTAENNDLCYMTRTSGSGGTWSSATCFEMQSVSQNPNFAYIVLANNRGVDDIALGAFDTTNDNFWAIVWDGSSWGTPKDVTGATAVTLTGGLGGTVGAEDSSNEFIAWAGAGPNTVYECEWTSSGWETTCATFDPDDSNGDDIKIIEARPLWGTDTVLACSTNDLADSNCWVWDGVSGTGGSQVNFDLSNNDGSGASNIYMTVGMDWNPDQSGTRDALIAYFSSTVGQMSWGTVNDATNAFTSGGTFSYTGTDNVAWVFGYQTMQSGNTEKVFLILETTTDYDTLAFQWDGSTNAPDEQIALTLTKGITNAHYTSGMAFQTYSSPPLYKLDIKHDYTSETCTGTRSLRIEAYHTDSEDIYTQVYNFTSTSWNTRITITATSDPDTYQTWTLQGTSGSEWNDGNPDIRFIGSSESSDQTQTDLLIDDTDIMCVPPSNYELNVTYDYSSIPTVGTQWALIIEGYRSDENILVQVADSLETTWTTRITISNTAPDQTQSYTLTNDELDGGNPSIKFLGSSESGDTVQSDVYLDVALIRRSYQTYTMEIGHNWTAVPSGDIIRLTVEGKKDTENFNIEVLTPPDTWNIRGTINSASDQTVTYDLDSNEYNSGAPCIRYIDVDGGEPSKSNLWLDWVKIDSITTSYALIVNQNVTGITGINPRIAIKGYRGDAENYDIQVWNFTSSAWDLRLDSQFTGSNAWHNVSIPSDNINAGVVRINYTDDTPTDDTESVLYIDYAGVFTEQLVSNNAPVMTDQKSVWEGTHNITQILQWNASDPDSDPLDWTLTTNGSFLSLDEHNTTAWVNGTPSWSDTNKWFLVNMTVCDDGTPNLCNWNEFKMYINNSVPVILEDRGYLEQTHNVTYNYIWNCSDPNGDVLTWQGSGNASYMSIDANSNTTMWWNGTPAWSNSEQYFDAILYCNDSFGGSDSDTGIRLWVNNSEAVINNKISSDTGVLSSPYYQDFNCTDSNSDDCRWYLNTNATWLNIGLTNGTLWGTAPGNPEIVWVNVTLNDDSFGETDFCNYTLTISTGNTAPTITNELLDMQIIRVQVNFDYEYLATDPENDPLTWSITGASWLEIDSSTGRVRGNTFYRGFYSFVITVSDGSLTDSTTLNIQVLEEYNIGKEHNLTFDFICTQISQHEIICEIKSTRGIPPERLNFDWLIEGKRYQGIKIVHYSEEGLQWGDRIWVNLTISLKADPNDSLPLNKIFESNWIPIWFYLLILFIVMFIIMLKIYSKQIREYFVDSKRKINKKFSKLIKSIGWTGALILGIAFIWFPTGTLEDSFTTLPLILILGLQVWAFIGALIIVACVIVLGKFIYKKIRKYMRTGTWN